MIASIPTPALGFIGRKNSGKTTLLEKVISELTARGLKIATVKHHGHPDFDIDIPGRDSYRHRMAGAQSTTIFSDVRFAQVTELHNPLSCEDVLAHLSNYDIALVEGFKKADIPHIELFRSGNTRDEAVVESSIEAWENAKEHNLSLPVAIVSNISRIQSAASTLDIPCFDYEEIPNLCTFIQTNFARPHLSIVVQAGGESKRMGTPKDTVLFMGRPLIMHTLAKVAPLANELIVTTNAPDRLHFLTQCYPAIRFEQDILPERGAIPGLYTALSVAHNELVAPVACDMADFPTTLLAKEALWMRPCFSPLHDAIIPKTETSLEPFAAVYRREPCLEKLSTFIHTGKAPLHKEELPKDNQNSQTQTNTEKANKSQPRIKDFLDTLLCGYVDCTHPVKIARFNGSFLNINTPEELQVAENTFSTRFDCLG